MKESHCFERKVNVFLQLLSSFPQIDVNIQSGKIGKARMNIRPSDPLCRSHYRFPRSSRRKAKAIRSIRNHLSERILPSTLGGTLAPPSPFATKLNGDSSFLPTFQCRTSRPCRASIASFYPNAQPTPPGRLPYLKTQGL